MTRLFICGEHHLQVNSCICWFKVLKTHCNAFSSRFSFHKRALRFMLAYWSSASGPDECDTRGAQRKHLSDLQVDVCGDVPLICSHLPGSALTLVCLPLIYDSHFTVCGLIQRSSLGWNTTGRRTGVTSHVTKTTGLQGGSITKLETKA